MASRAKLGREAARVHEVCGGRARRERSFALERRALGEWRRERAIHDGAIAGRRALLDEVGPRAKAHRLGVDRERATTPNGTPRLLPFGEIRDEEETEPLFEDALHAEIVAPVAVEIQGRDAAHLQRGPAVEDVERRAGDGRQDLRGWLTMTMSSFSPYIPSCSWL